MLENGQPFPSITASDLEGNEVTIDAITGGGWSVVLFYRGHW